tara:strand:- start:287 stop:664 length:378 start_codon:yes stop_codon:yes gene_type:complete
MKLYKKFVSALIIILILISCQTEVAGSSSSKSKVDAFAKIDKKSKKLFTKDDRIENYKKSVSQSESLKKSLNKNANYSGYGATAINKKSQKLNKVKTKKENLPKKKTNYGSKSINSQVYSAYSTN